MWRGKNGDKAGSRGRENSGLSYWIQEAVRRGTQTLGKCCSWIQNGHFTEMDGGERSCPKLKLWFHKLLDLHTLSIHANSCQHSQAHTFTQTHWRKHVVPPQPHSHKCGIDWHNTTNISGPCLVCGVMMFRTDCCQMWWWPKLTVFCCDVCSTECIWWMGQSCRSWAKTMGPVPTKGEQSKD